MTSEGQGRELDERILLSFRASYTAGAPFRQDRDLADELVLEVRPAVEALLFALDAAGQEDPDAPEHHEGLAMVTLLGRRAGTLGATPTAAVGLVEALAVGFAAVGRPIGEALLAPLRSMCFEGYVAGREDRLTAELADKAAASQGVVTVAPRCLGLILAGDQEADTLCEVVERFGRELFKADAQACIVDLTHLAGPAPDRAAEVLGADATARMLGVTCVFVGVTLAWREAAQKARVDTTLVCYEPSFEAALRRVLPICGLEMRRAARLPGPLRALLRKRH